MKIKSLKEFDVSGKRVLVRADFNVPLSSQGDILDDFRIRETLPTLKYLLGKKAKVILISHLGRPGGQKKKELEMEPIEKKLREYLAVPVSQVLDCRGSKVEEQVRKMQPAEIILLPNIRFYKEELEADDQFAKDIAKLADVYINDAFATCHREQASVIGLPKYLPHAAGFLLEKEIDFLSKIIENPKKPLVAIIGGAKIEETKLKLINKFSKEGNWVLIGGLVKKGIEEKGIRLDYPEKVIGPIEKVIGEDISQETIAIFKEKIKEAKTVFWGGVVGKTEKKESQRGSEKIAQAVIESRAFSVVGGGETVAFINRLGLAEKFSHVSTGGGAMLAFLAGDKLPGLAALEK